MSPAPLLAVSDLRVAFEGDRGRRTEAVSGVSFSLAPGRTLGMPAALHRALAFVEVDDVTLVVPHHLDLDVTWPDEELLQVERPVPERRLRLLFGDVDRLAQLLLVLRHPDAPPAPACGRFDHHGVPDLAAVLTAASPEDDSSEPGTTGTSASFAMRLAADLLPILSIASADGPMNSIPASCRPWRTRRSRRGSRSRGGLPSAPDSFGGLYQALGLQVAFPGRGRPDVDGLVGVADVEGLLVGIGVDGHGRDPSSWQARTTLSAISPRLATRIFFNIPQPPS